jgi:ribose/xylose/arabinose/galactoside ABC-type transport system permease subunit
VSWPSRRETGTLAGLLLLCLVLWIATPYFATLDNLRNVAEQSTVIGTLAVGMTFVILAGGIDLSVGSVVALAGVALALALRAGAGVASAVALALCVGALAGVTNGALVTLGRLPPFIATLGTMSVARGLALLLADGRPISGFPDGLRALATERVLGLPVSVALLLVLVALSHLVLTRTVLGRFTYAIGGNAEAARLAGIPVRGYTTGTYVIAGVSAALCATLLLARLNSAQPIAGIGYELDAIAAVVIGGTSLLGGSGSVLGTLLGALLMSVLRNGLNLLGVSSYIQQIAIGAVIVIAVLVDMALQRRLRHAPA